MRAAFLAVILLAGCQQPISNAPLGGVPGSSTVQKGLADAAYNLNSAISIGVLPADDPAAACVNQTLTTLGINPTTGASTQAANSFVPRQGDLISAGSVAYIYAQQAGSILNGGVTVPVGCEALIGKLVLDAAGMASKLGIGIPGLPNIPLPFRSAPAPAQPTTATPATRPAMPPPQQQPIRPAKATLAPSAAQIAAFAQSRLVSAQHAWAVP